MQIFAFFRNLPGLVGAKVCNAPHLYASLELEGEHQVAIANPYQFPRIAGEKSTIVDVRAIDQSGRKFVVEMQVADKTGFDNRVQYYISRDYSMQIDKGED